MTFCEHCRVIEVGWNRRYLVHSLTCVGGFPKLPRLVIYALATAVMISILPTRTARVASEQNEPAPMARSATAPKIVSVSDPTVSAIEDLVGRHSRVSPVRQARIARAVVESSQKHDVDPYLVTSILLVESSANPFAISNREAVGIMQIHVPTWGALADAERIDLFRVEDNIDLGTRILKSYIGRYGLWDGVIRYLGASGPTEEATTYVARVQGIYGDRMAD